MLLGRSCIYAWKKHWHNNCRLPVDVGGRTTRPVVLTGLGWVIMVVMVELGGLPFQIEFIGGILSVTIYSNNNTFYDGIASEGFTWECSFCLNITYAKLRVQNKILTKLIKLLIDNIWWYGLEHMKCIKYIVHMKCKFWTPQVMDYYLAIACQLPGFAHYRHWYLMMLFDVYRILWCLVLDYDTQNV